MLSFSRLITTISLVVTASGTFFHVLMFKTISHLPPLRTAVVTTIVPPASQGIWNDPANALDLNGTNTDTDTIVSTANIVDQKAGATGDPDQPVPATAVTAVDGQLTAAGTSNGTSSSRRRSTEFSRRDASDYELVFSGTGTGPNDRDGSIEGTAYLTFTLVPNSTYNVDACLAFCDSVELCGLLLVIHSFKETNTQVTFQFSPTCTMNSTTKLLTSKRRPTSNVQSTPTFILLPRRPISGVNSSNPYRLV